MKRLENNKAVGNDGIPFEVDKFASQRLLTMMSIFPSGCMLAGKLPSTFSELSELIWDVKWNFESKTSVVMLISNVDEDIWMFKKRSCDHFGEVAAAQLLTDLIVPYPWEAGTTDFRVNGRNLLNSNGIEIRATCSPETYVRNTWYLVPPEEFR